MSRKTTALAIAIAYISLYTAGCSASAALPEGTQSYTFQIEGTRDEAGRAIASALIDEGYILENLPAGSPVITAELNRSAILPDELSSGENGAANACVTIVGVAVVFGAIATLFSGNSSSEVTYYASAPEHVTGYRYVTTFVLGSEHNGLIDVSISTQRLTIENGVVTRQVPVNLPAYAERLISLAEQQITVAGNN